MSSWDDGISISRTTHRHHSTIKYCLINDINILSRGNRTHNICGFYFLIENWQKTERKCNRDWCRGHYCSAPAHTQCAQRTYPISMIKITYLPLFSGRGVQIFIFFRLQLLARTATVCAPTADGTCKKYSFEWDSIQFTPNGVGWVRVWVCVCVAHIANTFFYNKFV